MDPHLPLPQHLWFNRSLSYSPCGMSSILKDPSTFGCFLSSSHSVAFIILATLLQALSVSIISILEVGSEPDTRALWIYALIQSYSLFLSQWFLTFNLLFFSDNSVLWAEVFITCYTICITCLAITLPILCYPDLLRDVVMSLEPIILYVGQNCWFQCVSLYIYLH